MLYQNCREIPIHVFFEIVRTNNLELLVKSGDNPEQQQLQSGWLDILDEYNALFPKQKDKSFILKSRYFVLCLQLMSLEILKEVIESSGTTPEIVESCRKMRVQPENIQSYIAGKRNELKKVHAELEREPQTEENNAADELEKTLTLLKEQGFNFDRFTTPIIEFAYALNRLEERAAKQQSSKNALR